MHLVVCKHVKFTCEFTSGPVENSLLQPISCWPIVHADRIAIALFIDISINPTNRSVHRSPASRRSHCVAVPRCRKSAAVVNLLFRAVYSYINSFLAFIWSRIYSLSAYSAFTCAAGIPPPACQKSSIMICLFLATARGLFWRCDSFWPLRCPLFGSFAVDSTFDLELKRSALFCEFERSPLFEFKRSRFMLEFEQKY